MRHFLIVYFVMVINCGVLAFDTGAKGTKARCSAFRLYSCNHHVTTHVLSDHVRRERLALLEHQVLLEHQALL